MAYPATSFEEGVELTIASANTMHEVINSDAATEVPTESGPIPSLRKAIVDNFYFRSPINWAIGLSEVTFNQVRQFSDGTLWYAPSARATNPVVMPIDPRSSSDWKIFGSTYNSFEDQTKELIKEATVGVTRDYKEGNLSQANVWQTVYQMEDVVGDVDKQATYNLTLSLGSNDLGVLFGNFFLNNDMLYSFTDLVGQTNYVGQYIRFVNDRDLQILSPNSSYGLAYRLFVERIGS